MDKRHLLGMAAAVLMAGVAPAAALDNGPLGSGRCECFCSAGSAGGFTLYDNPGSCGLLTNKTCNLEDPATGGVRSGTLIGCWPEGSTSTPDQRALIQGDAVLDPGDGGQTVRPGLTAPLLNGTLQRQ